MINAALWSKCTPGLTARIESKLHKRGIDVTKHLDKSTKAVDLNGVDVVILLNEFCGHSDIDRIKNIATPQGKKVFLLSCRESYWDKDFGRLEKIMASKYSVSNENVTPLCFEVVKYRKEGLTFDQLLPKVAKYWSNGKLTNSHQLQVYLSNLVSTKRAPDFYLDFVEANNKKAKVEQQPNKDAQVPALGILKAPLFAHAGLPAKVEVKAQQATIAKPQSSNDAQVLEELYQDEIKGLKTKIALLEAELKSKSVVDKSKEIVDHLIKSVEFGFMNKTDAFDKIAEFVSKK